MAKKKTCHSKKTGRFIRCPGGSKKKSRKGKK